MVHGGGVEAVGRTVVRMRVLREFVVLRRIAGLVDLRVVDMLFVVFCLVVVHYI